MKTKCRKMTAKAAAKAAAFLIAAATLLALFAPAAAANVYDVVPFINPDINLAPRFPFIDVPHDAWYFNAVFYVSEHKLMEGLNKSQFFPDTQMTRGQFVTVLFRIAEGQGKAAANAGYAAEKFADVNKDDWFAAPVGWAAENGIVAGLTETLFGANEPISRAQAITVIDRYISSLGCSLPEIDGTPAGFTDSADFPAWAAEHIESLRESGLVYGDEKGRFVPFSGLTRAEASAIFMRLNEALFIETSPDDYVFGGYSLYCSPAALWFDNEDALDESGENAQYVIRSGYLTVDLSGIFVYPQIHPVVKMEYVGGNGSVTVGIDGKTKQCSADEKNGVYVLTADLSEISGSLRMESEVTFTFDDDSEKKITYIAFSKTRAASDRLNTETLADELSFDPRTLVDFREADAELFDRLDTMTEKRINEIKNTKSIDPSEITGTCYYISSLHGDDSNDGLSPETPWRSTHNLYRWYPDGTIRANVPDAGDGVFFERGSMFYSEIDNRSGSRYTFITAPGVTYSAYGEGEKPVFTTALKTDTPTGEWVKTEKENVWRLTTKIEVTEGKPKDGLDVGNFVLWKDGVATTCMPLDPYDSDNIDEFGTFEECMARMTVNCHGFHDHDGGYFYLYCDLGNPAEVYDDIKISLGGTAVFFGCNPRIKEETVLDNLAVKYSGRHGMTNYEGGAYYLTVQNCEVGYVGNRELGDGIENFGSCDGYTIHNCYVHDTRDDCITSQGTAMDADETGGMLMANIRFTDNVLIDSGVAIELWNKSFADPTSKYYNFGDNASLTKDVVISGNIFAYMDYDIFTSGWEFAQYDNVIIENNYSLYMREGHVGDEFHIGKGVTETAVKGFIRRGNVYVTKADGKYAHCNLIDAVRKNEQMFDARSIAYFRNLGVDEGSEFRWFVPTAHWSLRRNYFSTHWRNNEGQG